MTTDILTTVPTPKRRSPRWMWVLLILSLALYLLIIGVICGSLWAVCRGGFWDAPMFLERSHLMQVIETKPSVARAAIGLLCARLRATSEQAEAIALHPIEVRLARFLLAAITLGKVPVGQNGHASLDLGTSQTVGVFLSQVSARAIEAVCLLMIDSLDLKTLM